MSETTSEARAIGFRGHPLTPCAACSAPFAEHNKFNSWGRDGRGPGHWFVPPKAIRCGAETRWRRRAVFCVLPHGHDGPHDYGIKRSTVRTATGPVSRITGKPLTQADVDALYEMLDEATTKLEGTRRWLSTVEGHAKTLERRRAAVEAFLTAAPKPTGAKADRDDYITSVPCGALWRLHEAFAPEAPRKARTCRTPYPGGTCGCGCGCDENRGRPEDGTCDCPECAALAKEGR